MATPLRREQPDFNQDEETTTADLAQGKRPVSNVRGPQAVVAERGFEQPSATTEATEPLFPSNELETLRTRWKEVQTAFVDEPRKAVEQADGLVASAMKRLAECSRTNGTDWSNNGIAETAFRRKACAWRCRGIGPSLTGCCRCST